MLLAAVVTLVLASVSGIFLSQHWEENYISSITLSRPILEEKSAASLKEISNTMTDIVNDSLIKEWSVSEGTQDFYLLSSQAQKALLKYAGAVDTRFQVYLILNNGQIDFGYNGFAANEYGTWLFTNGILNTGFTGMTLNGGTWVYVTDGYISDTYTGMALNEYGWWYFNNGTLDFNYTGMALNEYGWWYFKNGQLDLGFTGIGSNEYGDWFFKDGRIAFEYTGSYNDGGQWYMVNSGFASKI